MKNKLHITIKSLKAKSMAFCFLLFAFNMKAQVNYVINGGFDSVNNCMDSYPGYINFAMPWDTLINGGGYGNVMNGCYSFTTNVSVPYNLSGGGYQQPHSGSGYSYIIYLKLSPNPSLNWRGYIQQMLLNKLISGKIYCVTYWASLVNYSTYSVDELGAYLDDGSIQSISWLHEAPANPQVKSPSGVFYMDTLNWMKVQGTFTANGTESYITLGNFRLNSATTFTALDGNMTAGRSLYFIDDVSVIEADLPAFAGTDKFVIPGDSVYIGRPPEIGLDDDCFWYQLPNTTTAIDTVAGLWVKPVTTSTYVVKQDICGMIKYDTVIVYSSAVGLATLSGVEAQNIQLFPNPANDLLNIIFDSQQAGSFLKFKILNSLNQVIREAPIAIGVKNNVIDIKDLPNGIYFLNLMSGKFGNVIKRFMVSH